MLVLKNNIVIAALILTLSVFVLYLPVTLLGYSNNPSFALGQPDIKRDFGCIFQCSGGNHIIDPGADGDQIFPEIKTISAQISNGIVPLWNPYLFTGVPLAADSTNYAFSPLILFYLLPTALWDIPMLLSVWLAGFFTFLLLRCWKLNFVSCILGSFFFMFSGTFTWYLPHDSVPVVLFTPLILFSIEKIIQTSNLKYIALGSTAMAMAILGGHIESIALLILLCTTYFVFRILHITFSKSMKQVILQSRLQGEIIQEIYNKKKIIIKSFVLFVGGLGLSAFFILPAYEYLANSPLTHSSGTGLASFQPLIFPFVPVISFVPYFVGQVQTYASPLLNGIMLWDFFGSYVGASCLFFSLIGVIFTSKVFDRTEQKRIAQFFFGISIFFLLKNMGIPIINWIGALPILNMTIFMRYDGFIWSLGFAIAAAFGIESLIRSKIKPRHLSFVALISSGMIILLALSFEHYFTWEAPAGPYVIFQIIQALFFIMAAYLLSLSLHRDKRGIISISTLIFLELSLYIPLGLPAVWQLFRSIVVIVGISVICLVNYLPLQSKTIDKQKTIKLKLIIITLSLVILGQQLVYLESPMGLPLKRDVFEPTPLTEFLKANLGQHRIFSLDMIFRPDYPSAYGLNTIGLMLPLDIGSSTTFIQNYLDPYTTIPTIFDYIPQWRAPGAPDLSTVFKTNEKYYDFLGVKYIVASSTDPNSHEMPITGNAWHVIGSTDNLVTQTFVPQIDNITSISIDLGTYDRINHGDIMLAVDSIPYDKSYHRITSIRAEDVINGGFNEFVFSPLENVNGKKLSLTLSHPQAVLATNAVAVSIHDANSQNPSLSHFTDLLKGQISVDGNVIDGAMAFIVKSTSKYPLVFNDKQINVYENKNIFPRAFLVGKYQLTNSYQDAQDAIKNQTFNLRDTVVLEKNLPLDEKDQLNPNLLISDATSNVTITSYLPNKVSINVHAEKSSLLILTDSYYPGWQAHVDGKESMIYRADGLVRAVFVPAGSHTVEFSYLPESFVIGVMISLITAGILAGVVMYSRKNRLIINNKQI